MQVFPGWILGRETQPEAPVIRGSVKGGVTSATAENCEPCVRFVGRAGSRARVAYTVDGVYDEFRVKFEPATRFELMTEDGDRFTVVVHGLTGRVAVMDGEVDADRHMRRDAAGNEAEER